MNEVNLFISSVLNILAWVSPNAAVLIAKSKSLLCLNAISDIKAHLHWLISIICASLPANLLI